MAARKNELQDFSVASLTLHAQNFASALEKNVVPKFTNRLSWTLHEISLSHIFPYIDSIQGHIRENEHQAKRVYSHILPSLTYFTD